MSEGDPAPSFSTDTRHVFRVRRRWIGENRSLIDDRTVEFTEFLPFRPRGPQILLDPFEPQCGALSLTGRVVSPARVLDPNAELHAWCDAQSLELDAQGSFSATTTLHAGTDQIHVRAIDPTQMAGRGSISTWTPLHPDDPEHSQELDGNAGHYESKWPPAGVRKPIRYGRTRAEVQRFVLVPALTGRDSIDLVLLDEHGAPLGRTTVAVTHQSGARSHTDWVCITAVDPATAGIDPAELAAVEGPIIRVPTLRATLVLELPSGQRLGDPLRMSGLDPGSGPDPILSLDDPSSPHPLKLVMGGRYGLDELNLQWLTTSDADDVLLPSEATTTGDEALESVMAGHTGPLSDLDPVELADDEVLLPAGWAALAFEARECGDPWDHDQQLEVLTYQPASELDDPQAHDFVHSGRQPRAQWHPSDPWAVNPDQVFVKLVDETADADLADLSRRRGLRVAGTVRRDGHVLFESPEPLDLDELQALVQALEAEAIVEVAALNYIILAEHESVATVRVPDVLRAAAATAPQPGCYAPYDILTLRHHLQTRVFPAQAIVEHLRAQQVTQSDVALGITDDGFGNASLATISPDFAAPRLPWLGRVPGPGAAAVANTWAAFPANVGATLAFTNAAMIDPGGSGHGTRTLHAMAGYGRPFPATGLASTAPALAPAAAAIANYVAAPWCVGVAPMATVLPMRTIGVAGGTWFSGLSAIRYAFLQGVDVVNTSAGLNHASVPAAAAAGGWYATMVAPVLAQARASGGIWVVSGGNRPLAHNQHFHSVLAPTGARAAGSNPVVAVTPTSQSLLPVEPLGPNFPLTFTNPWNSVETSVLNGWDANFGPESTVAAPGDDLNLRAASLTAASTIAHLGRGSGTSFAAPQTAGLLGLMKLADRIMGRAAPRPGVPTPADDANRLIDLLCFTAHKDTPLFPPAAAAAQFSTELGHGRIDAWAAVLSTLNNGPMFAGTAPHTNLVNTGTYVAPAQALFYGFEIDSPALHAHPWLVNVDTGAREKVVDAMGLDPAIDPRDPTRPAWTYQARSAGTGDQILPPSRHPGPTPSYSMQFSIRRAQLQRYTHLCFERDPQEPPIVATGGMADLEPGDPARFFYGLPLAPLLNHDVRSADITPFGVDMRHFIFKAHTQAHDRRLRVTFDRVDLKVPVAGPTVNMQWSVGPTASGLRSITATAGMHTLLLGAASHSLYVPPATPLRLRFEVQGLGVAQVDYAPPATPTAPHFTPWGLGHRVLEQPGFRVHLRVEQEPNLPRAWQVTLTGLTLQGAPADTYEFAVQSGGVRSAWGNPITVGAVAPSVVVPIAPPALTVRSPFIPGEQYGVMLLARRRSTMQVAMAAQRPASLASHHVQILPLNSTGLTPFRFNGRAELRSVIQPLVFG